jgi:hypothetical protein
MKQVPNYGDGRQTSFCAYCGGNTKTRDHVPSKVFLDKKYPTNLPVVPACKPCNHGFSLDEEYVACVIECSLTGSIDANGVQRQKVRRILRKKPKLVARLAQKREENLFGDVSFHVEVSRVKNVVIKHARGHAAFELNEPQLEAPSNVAFAPLLSLSSEILKNFETPLFSTILPEVGSRAMQRLVDVDAKPPGWITVQPGRYRYLTSVGDGIVVRFVFSEYLACEVRWTA